MENLNRFDMTISELLDRIDEIRANSVTDEEFEKIHGKSIDESVADTIKEIDKRIAEK